MARFSERYGYVTPSNVIIRECITEPIKNSICNWLDLLRTKVGDYKEMDKFAWTYFFNKRNDEYPYSYYAYNKNYGVILDCITNEEVEWFYIFDLIEFIYYYYSVHKNQTIASHFKNLSDYLNYEFKRHHYAYRLVNGRVVEVTVECEIKSIESAINDTDKNVKTHLQTALEKLSLSQCDYRNSIKESISAVECICREITGESTLDKALKKLESKGVVFNSQMKKGLENLYYYTNDGSTGIRHALMDDKNAPTADEAIFMLVSCSAFVNYLIKKKS